MAVIHITETDAVKDFAGLMARVRSGTEIAIEDGSGSVALLRSPSPVCRTMAECIALLPESSTATVDEDFAADVVAAIAERREVFSPAELN